MCYNALTQLVMEAFAGLVTATIFKVDEATCKGAWWVRFPSASANAFLFNRRSIASVTPRTRLTGDERVSQYAQTFNLDFGRVAWLKETLRSASHPNSRRGSGEYHIPRFQDHAL